MKHKDGGEETQEDYPTSVQLTGPLRRNFTNECEELVSPAKSHVSVLSPVHTTPKRMRTECALIMSMLENNSLLGAHLNKGHAYKIYVDQ